MFHKVVNHAVAWIYDQTRHPQLSSTLLKHPGYNTFRHVLQRGFTCQDMYFLFSLIASYPAICLAHSWENQALGKSKGYTPVFFYHRIFHINQGKSTETRVPTDHFSSTPPIIPPPTGNYSPCFSQTNALLAQALQVSCPALTAFSSLSANPLPKPNYTLASPLPWQILLLGQVNLALRHARYE